MNSSASSVKFRGMTSLFVFKGMDILEFGTRENVVSFGKLVHLLDSVDTI